MDRSWWGKVALLTALIVASFIYVYPSLSDLDPENTRFPFTKKINLGLDLQGGLYMVLGVDFDQVYKEVVGRQAANLEGRMKEKKLTVKKVSVSTPSADDPRIRVEFNPTQKDAVYKLIKDEFWSLRLTNEGEGVYELGLGHTYRSEVREKTISQSIEVIRNRIDEFGVSEPSITSQGIDRVVVELPGVKDIERAKELIGRTAKLEFRIVVTKEVGGRKAPFNVAPIIAQVEKEHHLKYDEDKKFSEYVTQLNKLAKDKLPEGTEIAFQREDSPGSQNGGAVQRIPYLLYSRADVTGNELLDAQVSFDPNTRQPEVVFQLNPRGASAFGALTKEHIGEPLAIVLDNIVASAPNIRSEIPNGRGSITLGAGNGDQLLKEAKDLAIVLRAGALPAKLEFLEQRVVGPSLGHDSIRNGATASVIGAALVFLFIMIYYRVSGLIAVVSLAMNVLFVFAILVGLEATLTLPGIAGIALTVGIAVDSNVVIYERIREEIRAGKSIQGSVQAGFQKAIRTILDANVTNAAAGIVLLTYGTGPIKGFAVTLLIGIVTTLFTAVFVCKLFFELYLNRLQQKSSPSVSI